MAVTRILPDAPGSWALYEIFENRVRSFIKEYLPETNEVRGDPEGIIRIAPGFHQAVYELSGNPVLSTMTAAIDAVFNEQILRTIDLVPHQEAFLDDHQAIANAIVNSDAELAKKLAAFAGQHRSLTPPGPTPLH